MKFYDVNPAACYLNKEMFVIRKVLPYSSTRPNESLAKDLLILSTTPVDRCVHCSFKKGFIYTVSGIVLLTNPFHDIKPSPFNPSVELVSPIQDNQFSLCLYSIS